MISASSSELPFSKYSSTSSSIYSLEFQFLISALITIFCGVLKNYFARVSIPHRYARNNLRTIGSEEERHVSIPHRYARNDILIALLLMCQDSFNSSQVRQKRGDLFVLSTKCSWVSIPHRYARNVEFISNLEAESGRFQFLIGTLETCSAKEL